jgi:hypothetical protein
MPGTPRAHDSELAERITTLWQRAMTLAPLSVVPGVQRFHTIEEANEARNQATLERMRQGGIEPDG